MEADRISDPRVIRVTGTNDSIVSCAHIFIIVLRIGDFQEFDRSETEFYCL